MGDIVHMRGEGGSVIPMELPFPEHIAARVAKGHIVRVNEDGSDYVPAKNDPDLLEPEHHDERVADEPDSDGPVKPKAAQPKADWVAYAESQGMSHEDADAMSKADLVKRFS